MNTQDKILLGWEKIEINSRYVIIKNVDKKREFYFAVSSLDELPVTNFLGYPVDIGNRLEYVANGDYLFVRGNPNTEVTIIS